MSKLRNLLLVSLSIVILPSSALGWDCTAHQVVQQIALTRLNNRAKANLAKLGRSLRLGLDRYSELTMACFMDDARSEPSYDFTRSWHFIDRPLSLDGSPLPGTPEPEPNILTKLKDITEAIKMRIKMRTPGTADQKSSKRVTDSELAAYLVHLVADAHQPLHCAILISEKYPKGDFGGNRIQLSSPRRSLHAYWDQAGGLFGSTDYSPDFGKVSGKKIQEYADELTSAFPESALDWSNMDPAAWVNESYELARSAVYVGIKDGGSISKDYQAKTQQICRERLAMAGYRLAALLNEIYSGTNEPSSKK